MGIVRKQYEFSEALPLGLPVDMDETLFAVAFYDDRNSKQNVVSIFIDNDVQGMMPVSHHPNIAYARIGANTSMSISV